MVVLKKWLFCDIDHVLSDAFHRDSMIDADHSVVNEPTWELYHTAAKHDKPIKFTIDMVNAMFREGYHVVLITARPSWCRKITQDWLTKYNVNYDSLIMRPNNDHPDYRLRSPVLKQKQIVNYILAMNIDSQDDILLIDDRADICAAMAEIGVQTLQYHHNRHRNGKAEEIWAPKAPDQPEAVVAPQAAAAE